jgi:aminoglycoside phosphotransferase (APT) family kinase protein
MIEEACPELRPADPGHLGRGWDHDVYACDGRVFRFPRHEASALALELEVKLLPWLAPQLPATIPVPRWSGMLDRAKGWRFLGHKFIPGMTVCDAELDDEDRAALAPRLANFTRVLHAIPLEGIPVPLPLDELGRLDFARRVRSTQGLLAQWQREGLLPYDIVVRLFRKLDDWPGEDDAEALVLVHADLHSRNLLVTPDGRLSGVIDWVDAHRGNRAVDLATAYKVLPPSARDAFFSTYGGADNRTRARARFRAIDHSTRTLAGAIERRDEAFARVSKRALIEAPDGE